MPWIICLQVLPIKLHIVMATATDQETRKKESTSVSLRAATPSNDSQRAQSISYRGAANLLRTASVPDVVGQSPKAAYSSITIAARKVPQAGSSLQGPVYPSCPTRPVRAITPPQPLERRALSTPRCTRRFSNSQPDLCRQNPTVVRTNELRQSYPTADGFAMREPGKRKVQPLQHRHSYTEGNSNQSLISDSFLPLSSQPSYRSCVHLEVPLRSTSSVVFLDKSLSISLVDLSGRRAAQPTLYRSTLSVHLSVPSCHRSSTDNKPAKTDESYGRPKAAMVGRNKFNGRKSGLGHCRGALSKQWGHKVEQIAPAHGVNSRADDPDTHCHGATLGFLSFKGPSPSNTELYSSHQQAASISFFPPQEALELFRPDFISRSQGRVRRLEQRYANSLACASHPWTANTIFPTSLRLPEFAFCVCRIYNKLPEVTKKKEEEKKRAVSQTNRLRAELFKKVELLLLGHFLLVQQSVQKITRTEWLLEDLYESTNV
uniref:Uncharacterized protein n=1 Tax=Myripristis murdjan TaxID=586833 RepID=A0A667XNG4_9TELE